MGDGFILVKPINVIILFGVRMLNRNMDGKYHT